MPGRKVLYDLNAKATLEFIVREWQVGAAAKDESARPAGALEKITGDGRYVERIGSIDENGLVAAATD